MNTETLKYQIALTQVKGVGNILAKELLSYVGNVESIFKQSKSQLMKIPNIGEFVAGQITKNNDDIFRRAEKEVEFVMKNKITPLFFTDENYPFRLKECYDAPVIIYTKGNQDFNKGWFVGVVGTRKITEYGKELCDRFIGDLANKDITIVSGLAYGADICAHKSALHYGLNTIGVLGHGLDRIYPPIHRPVAIKMLEQGALLTEYMSDTNPDKQNFVKRNRIIAGLVDALLVVESAEKGGSLISAEIADSYNREVFAFPGRVGDEYSAGCNKLIKRNKAIMIECATDLEKAMGWEQENGKTPMEPTLFTQLTEEEQQIVRVLRTAEALHVNQIALQLELPVSQITPLLIEMEFKNVVKCLPGNLFRAI